MRATSLSEPGAPGGLRPARRYVAIGDSFSAGVPDLPHAGRWPDEVAARLRAASPALDYRNLAVPGADSAAVAHHQLGLALRLRPDVVTAVCGANDVLQSTRPDVDRYATTLRRLLGCLLEELPGAAVVTATTPNFAGFLELRERSQRRVADGMARLAEASRAVAGDLGVVCLEFAAHPRAVERQNFAGDGYHPSAEGTRRAAAAFCAALRHHFAIAAPPLTAPVPL